MRGLNYERLRISREHLRADTLRLSGVYDGVEYAAILTSLEVRYDWRMLLNGEVQSVTLEGLEVELTENAPGARPAPANDLQVSKLLPAAHIAALPVDSLDIRHWSLDYLAPGLPPITATGELQLTDQLRLTLESSHLDSHLRVTIWTEDEGAYPRAEFALSDGDTAIANLAISLNPGEPDDWQWSLQGKLDYAPLLSWLRRLDMATNLPVDISTFAGLEVVGSSTFAAQIGHPDTLHIPAVTDQSPLGQFNAEVHTSNRIHGLDYTAITGLTANFDISMNLSGGETRFTLSPTEVTAMARAEALSLPAETLAWLRWGDSIPLRWRNPELIDIKPVEGGGWSVQLHNNLLVIGAGDSELRLETLELETTVFPEDEWRLNAQLSARSNARLRKKPLPAMKLAITHVGAISQSDFSLSLDDIAESMSFALQGKANLASGHGSYRTTLSSGDLPFASETLLPLAQSFGLLSKRLNVDLSSGRMSLDSELQSSGFSLADLKAKSTLKIVNLSGIYDQYQFEGVALTAHWTGIEQWQTLQPIEFSMAKLDVGFEVLDTRARLSLPKAASIVKPVVNIEAYSSVMFGGRVFLAEPQAWDFSAETNKLTLSAQDWRLADMVAMQHGQDNRAQGIMEGKLPVTVSGGRIMITGGYLRAVPPGGSIRYIANEASQALAASSPELKLAMDLLSNFQFDVLSTEVELDADGNLFLGLSLAGKNPAQYEGRPINFNINLEQNLDPLLQSLRLSDKLVEQLEDRIK